MLSAFYSNTLQQRLIELGYVEGESIVTQRRNNPGTGGQDRLDALAAELVKIPVSVLVAMGSAAALAAKRATTTIPIVMVGSADPVGLGLVSSLGRPGGNVTGVSSQALELSAKRLQIIKDVIPSIQRVAVIWSSADLDSKTQFQATEQAAQTLGISVYSLEMQLAEQQTQRRVAEAAQAGAEAVILLDEAGSTGAHTELASAAIKQRLPSMSGDRFYTSRLNGGFDGVRTEPHSAVPASRRLCGQDPARRQPSRLAGRAAQQVRLLDQPAHGTDPRTDHSPVGADRGNRAQLTRRASSG